MCSVVQLFYVSLVGVYVISVDTLWRAQQA